MEDIEQQTKQERSAQLKILESLDFNSFITNKEDVEEQFGGNLKKKFKNEKGDAKNIEQKERNFKSQYKKREFNKKPKENGENQTGEDEQSENKEKKQQKERNVKPKAPKEISSNWQKFLQTTQKQDADKQVNGDKTPNGNNKVNNQAKSKQESSNDSVVYKSLEPQNNSFKGTTPIVAIDCEMVQCVGSSQGGLPTQELARVSIVNYNGHVILDSYVRPQKKIRDYLTKVSGITYNLIKNAPTFPEIKDKIFNALKGKIIAGHSIQHDLSAIKFEPERDNMLRDISNYKELKFAGKKVSLKKMVKQELGITFQEGSHDSISDARAALLIYKKYQKQIDQEQGGKK